MLFSTVSKGAGFWMDFQTEIPTGHWGLCLTLCMFRRQVITAQSNACQHFDCHNLINCDCNTLLIVKCGIGWIRWIRRCISESKAVQALLELRVCATCTCCITSKLWVALGVQVCSALVLHLCQHYQFCVSLKVKCDPQSGGEEGWSWEMELGRKLIVVTTSEIKWSKQLNCEYVV